MEEVTTTFGVSYAAIVTGALIGAFVASVIRFEFVAKTTCLGLIACAVAVLSHPEGAQAYVEANILPSIASNLEAGVFIGFSFGAMGVSLVETLARSARREARRKRGRR